MAYTVYLTKEQRISITNFLKWLIVDFDVELNEAIFEDYISGIGSTMHECIDNEVLESLPKEVKVDIVNKLLLSFGKISDLSILLKLSQYLEDSMIGSWSESVMIRSIIVIAQYFFGDSVRIVPMTFNKPTSKLLVYLDNATFEITSLTSSFSAQKLVKITLDDQILHKVMEYEKQPSQFDIEELLGNLLCMSTPVELSRCEYIQSSFKDMSYLDIKLTNFLHKGYTKNTP